MIKLLLLVVVTLAQDTIICSGFIRIPKQDRADINIDEIEIKLVSANSVEQVEISENGFYSIEIEDETQLIDYSLIANPKVKGFVANPSQINLKFSSKTFDEASSFCNKQLNFSIKRAPQEDKLKQEQEQRRKTQEQIELQQKQKLEQQLLEQEEQARLQREQEQYELEQIELELQQQANLKAIEEEKAKQIIEEEVIDIDEKAFDHFRLIGQFEFEGEFKNNEKALYSIKSFKVFDSLDEPVQGKTLYFHNYFEVETNEAKPLKLQLVVEKAKEKGESTAKQFNFEQKISKNQLLKRQISNQPIIFQITQEIPTKEQNKVASIVAPLLIFGLVLAMFNYDKLLKKK